ncbi:hypothetical protein TrVGV298_007898 [Trichoderma virens]|nr:hypothetical protein TrVGV298_007898 [Trichoderma virens]
MCFHREIVQPLVQSFLNSGIKGLDEWESPPYRRYTKEAGPTSDKETPYPAPDEQIRRLYMAFYRYEYACRIFPQYISNKSGPMGDCHVTAMRAMILEFLRAFTLEEKRDLKKVTDWVTNLYRELMKKSKESTRRRLEPGKGCSSVRDNYLELDLIMRGLAYLNGCLPQEKFDMKKMREIQCHYDKLADSWGSSYLTFLEDAYDFASDFTEWRPMTSEQPY